ncbi:MAG: hypothetical protein AAF805_06040 [Planctomycetota bacterium]
MEETQHAVEELQQSVDAAWRRLSLRRWAGRLAISLAAAMSVALVAVLAPKVVALPTLPDWWAAAWLVGAAIVGTTWATLRAVLFPKSRLDAAAEIDRRFDLRERVASSLSLDEESLATPAGAAVVRDARSAVARVDVAERFTLGLDRRAWLPVAPAAIALSIATLVSDRVAAGVDPTPAADQQAAAEEVKKAAEKARQELKKRRERAERDGLADATALLKKVEEGAAELTEKKPKDIAQTAAKLNDLTRELAERREKLGGGEALRRQMNQMKDLGRGPAEKAADAMRRGDWKAALREVQRLQQKLGSGELGEKGQQQLADQLKKMQQRLAEAGERAEQQRQELQKQLADAERRGDTAQAGKLQQKLDQANAQAAQNQQMQQLAEQMQQAQQALERGDAAEAAQAMQQLAQQMQALQKQQAEMEMLDAALADIDTARTEMGLEPGQCQNGQCNKPGGGEGQMAGRGRGKGDGQGQGMGEGRGGGDRPDEENPVRFRDSQVRQNVGRGASTFGGLVDGPSVKGEVAESIKTGLSSETVAPADPLTGERLPRSRREHAEEYFRSLREAL